MARDSRFGDDWEEGNIRITHCGETTEEQVLADILSEGLEAMGPMYRTESFEEAGTLTNDAGFMVRTRDGQSFQVTIVRGR